MSSDKTLSVINKTDSFFYVKSDRSQVFLNSDDISRFDMNDLSWINEFKNDNFSKIDISILTYDFTLLPSNIAKDTSSTEIERLLNLSNNKTLDHDLVYSQDLEIFYAYDKSAHWLNEIKKCSDNIRIQHYFTPILQNLSYSFKQDGVFAFIEKNEVGIVVMRNQNPLLVNLYRINDVEEYLYFILLAYQQTGMSADQDKLYLAGQIMTESQLYRYIYKYIRNVCFLNNEFSPFADSFRNYDMMSLMKYG